MVDYNYDEAIFEPTLVDISESAGTVRVKITDVLSDSLQMDVENGK